MNVSVHTRSMTPAVHTRRMNKCFHTQPCYTFKCSTEYERICTYSKLSLSTPQIRPGTIYRFIDTITTPIIYLIMLLFGVCRRLLMVLRDPGTLLRPSKAPAMYYVGIGNYYRQLTFD